MREVESSRTIKERARAALSKPSLLGEDIDLSKYTPSTEDLPYQGDPSQLSEEQRGQMAQAGIILDDRSQRSGTIIQMDNSVIHSLAGQDGLELMATSQALRKYDWILDYWWRAVAVDSDKYTAHAELNQNDGYFIRALPHAKVIYPVQACLYLAKKNLAQNVHNIVIAEEDSELHIITGCTTAREQESGLHLGISEFYIKPGAKLTFTMIHNWTPGIAVRPRTGVIIEENGIFLSNYVIMRPVQSLQTNPGARCVGENSIARFNSILVSPPGSSMDVGSQVFLDARGARTEIISRAITTGGEILSRGYIEGNAPQVKGHMECNGLILAERGIIHAVPELKGTIVGIDLSHEAAVGKMSEEELEYLMARGLTRTEATATIVRGFLRVDVEGLPPALNAELRQAVEVSESEKELM